MGVTIVSALIAIIPHYTYQFDCIVPQTGLLHLQMNSGEAFMNCNWDVFMKDICEELRCKSENSLKYIQKGITTSYGKF